MMSDFVLIQSISELHTLEGLEKPIHPLISVNYFDLEKPSGSCCGNFDKKFVLDLYQIVLEDGAQGSLRYGRNSYDFQEGSLIFMKPKQVFFSDGNYTNYHSKGWSLSFHPDLIRQSELGKIIDNYTFFSYEANEALHLSDKEKSFILNLVKSIELEYSQNLDKHSQKLITTSLQLLLDYCTRYYDRQFYLRANLNKEITLKLESFLRDYYQKQKQYELGVPSVKYCADFLGLSPNYLSDLLKKETGRNAMEHIHYFIIEKAKTSILNSDDRINQIAYELGFESAPYFSKLFRKKTGLSPKEFKTNFIRANELSV